MVYVAKTPTIVRPLYKDMVWNMPTSKREVYITFDDGPDPEVTPLALDLLDKHHAKATFFCVGNNVERYPELFADLQARGHAVGNHTWQHLKGWNTPDFTYLRDVLRCDALIDTTLFRPPYGKIKKSQAKALKTRFSIVMWDVLSGDFDPSINPEKCIENVLNNTEAGSIIVFHDSQKAATNMLGALPAVLKALKTRGFELKALPPLPIS